MLVFIALPGNFGAKRRKRQLCLPLETLHRRSNPFREAGLEAGRLFARKDRVLHGLPHAKLQGRLRGNLNRRSRRWVTALARLSL
jgi:hypothetical protein